MRLLLISAKFLIDYIVQNGRSLSDRCHLYQAL